MVVHRTLDAGTDNNTPGEIGPDEWNDPHAYDMICTLGKYTTDAATSLTYDGQATFKGLGIALLDFTNLTRIRFGVYYNKGTPNTEWQLWNVTDSVEIGLIADSGAAGEKVLDSGEISVVGITGLKLVRLRVHGLNNSGQVFTFYGGYLKAGRV